MLVINFGADTLSDFITFNQHCQCMRSQIRNFDINQERLYGTKTYQLNTAQNSACSPACNYWIC